jgi:hypothetical membrane protein
VDHAGAIEVLITIYEFVFFVFFVIAFIDFYTYACSQYLFSFKRKPYFRVKRKYIIILLILFLNLIIIKIIQMTGRDG